MKHTQATDDDQRLRTLAESLGCITEGDLLLLTQWEPGTARDKRKRGDGPPYIRFGLNYLYPVAGLKHFLHAMVREPRGVPVKATL
jgi:hypothetical protein